MSALESQVSVTVRGTAGTEASRPRFLHAARFFRDFLQALLRFAFLECPAPVAPSAAGEATRRHAQAATRNAIGNVKPPSPLCRFIGGNGMTRDPAVHRYLAALVSGISTPDARL